MFAQITKLLHEKGCKQKRNEVNKFFGSASEVRCEMYSVCSKNS